MTDQASDLRRRLRAERDLVALVPCPRPDADDVARRTAAWIGASVESLAAEAFSPAGLDQSWGPETDSVLTDIDLLFTPQLQVEPLSHLRRMGRSVALVAVWPGRIDGGRLTYSEPGRSDHYDVPAKHVLVLDPVETHFPDEDPYTAEYYPA